MGTHSNYQPSSLPRTEVVVTLLEVSEIEDGVVALPIGHLKTRCGVGAGTEMRTQYLPAH